MSVYKKIVEAVEDSIYHYHHTTSAQVAWYVEWWTGIRNVNPREIEKIINRVTTSYKEQ